MKQYDKLEINLSYQFSQNSACKAIFFNKKTVCGRLFIALKGIS